MNVIFQSNCTLLLLLFFGNFFPLHLFKVFQTELVSFPFHLLKILILSLDGFSDFFYKEKTISRRNKAWVKNKGLKNAKKYKKDKNTGSFIICDFF